MNATANAHQRTSVCVCVFVRVCVRARAGIILQVFDTGPSAPRIQRLVFQFRFLDDLSDIDELLLEGALRFVHFAPGRQDVRVPVFECRRREYVTRTPPRVAFLLPRWRRGRRCGRGARRGRGGRRRGGGGIPRVGRGRPPRCSSRATPSVGVDMDCATPDIAKTAVREKQSQSTYTCTQRNISCPPLHVHTSNTPAFLSSSPTPQILTTNGMQHTHRPI